MLWSHSRRRAKSWKGPWIAKPKMTMKLNPKLVSEGYRHLAALVKMCKNITVAQSRRLCYLFVVCCVWKQLVLFIIVGYVVPWMSYRISTRKWSTIENIIITITYWKKSNIHSYFILNSWWSAVSLENFSYQKCFLKKALCSKVEEPPSF